MSVKKSKLYACEICTLNIKIINFRPRSTTEYVPPMYDYVLNDKVKPEEDGCEALPPSMTAPKTGQKAWDSKYM